MGIFLIDSSYEQEFVNAPEIFPDVHLGQNGVDEYCLVVGCRVIITFDENLSSQLDEFYRRTWGPSERNIIQRYVQWMDSLKEPKVGDVKPVVVSRPGFLSIMASAFPPPPPNRPSVTPAYTPPPSLPTNFYAHLPFQTTTDVDEHFYRFEAWPQSLKITVGAAGKIAPGTYASPASELPFITTGFGAVARNALPSYFPAVFRYELQPNANTPMRCGAVIPNYGQSGGGVEVFFPTVTTNVGAIANPVVMPPM
jgi:hypothetical protein